VAALYYWQRKQQAQVTVHSVARAAPKPQSKFVALRVKDALEQIAQPSWGCTLVLGGGMRLEMSALPDPQWLVAVGRANQGGH
jgi:hypothetical protein